MKLSSIRPPPIQEAECKAIPNHEFFDVVCQYRWLDYNYQQMPLKWAFLLAFIVVCFYTYLLLYQHRKW